MASSREHDSLRGEAADGADGASTDVATGSRGTKEGGSKSEEEDGGGGVSHLERTSMRVY